MIKKFLIDFITMLIVFMLVEFIFYKLNLIHEINIFYILGFMTGWSIIQIIKLVKSKK